MKFMEEIEGINAVLFICQLGSQGGNAVADILSGKVSPSGKLADTWAKTYSDIPFSDEFSYLNGNLEDEYYKEDIFVGYRWTDAHNCEPTFPFGHGLSYTTFEIGEPTMSKRSLKAGGKITIKCEVRNTGKREGAEVVQLYIGDKESSLPRPVKELKGFQKLQLAAGESGVAEFTITEDELKFFDDKKHEWVAEAGEFTAYIATSAEDVLYTLNFTLK
jgi:beta-glucosidase